MPFLVADINKRYYYYDTWYTTGRWALAGVLIGMFVLFLIGFSICCFTARRRRASGREPFRGTGWTTRLPGMRTAPRENYYTPPSGPPQKE